MEWRTTTPPKDGTLFLADTGDSAPVLCKFNREERHFEVTGTYIFPDKKVCAWWQDAYCEDAILAWCYLPKVQPVYD